MGAGLTGATAARVLQRAGAAVEVFESQVRVGGQLATERLHDVLFEPFGAHILHTGDAEVWRFLLEHTDVLPYRHFVRTEISTPSGPRLLSWPPQVDELTELPQWPDIRRELAARPATPRTASFATWCVDLVGPTLYGWFIDPYTRKQWGQDPALLSASWAPRRIELRDDGYRDLFRDPYQGWPREGYAALVERLLRDVPVHLGATVTATTADSLPGFDAWVVTAALDAFWDHRLGTLPWRGVKVVHEYVPGYRGTRLPAPVVNHPPTDRDYTRRYETKWMSGQDVLGTVVSHEYPGAPLRHYPVDDAAGANRRLAHGYRTLLTQEFGGRAHAAGRLARYSYIDMDQAVRQGLNVARRVLSGRRATVAPRAGTPEGVR